AAHRPRADPRSAARAAGGAPDAPSLRAEGSALHGQRREGLAGRRGRRRPDRPGARQPAHQRQQVREPGGARAALGHPGRRGGRVLRRRQRAGPGGGSARPRLRPVLAGGERRDPVGGHGPRPRHRQVTRRVARRRDHRELDPRQGRYLSIRAADRQGWTASANGSRRQDEGGGCQMTRLLVADDSETVLLMLKRRLEMEGYEVATSTDGVEALDRLRELGPKEPDVILLDAMMPNKSGTEVLEELRGVG